GDRVSPAVRPEPRHLPSRDLEAGKVAVVADPELPEPQAAHERLRPGPLAGLLGGERRPAGEPGGGTHPRRRCPRRAAQGPRQLPYLCLAEPGVDERGPDAALPGRGHPGTMVPEVIDGRAVD